MKKFWECKQSANQNEADVFIFGEIVSFKWDDTDTTAASFQKDLKELQLEICCDSTKHVL